MSDDPYMNQTDVMQLAEDTVNVVIEEMPKDLTPDEEKVYLTNAGRIMGRSCMIIQEMVNAKAPTVLH